MALVLDGINPFVGAAFSFGLSVLQAFTAAKSQLNLAQVLSDLRKQILEEVEGYVSQEFAQRDRNDAKAAAVQATNFFLKDWRWTCSESSGNASQIWSCKQQKAAFTDAMKSEVLNPEILRTVFGESCVDPDGRPVEDPNKICAEFQSETLLWNQSAFVEMYLQNSQLD
ncbi:unnamed protein product [Symbiodinium natans]|uniref:Uncharacterized protein n=1 Tax=Symbiodinium natans TaxID=878477 RepID=A0A812HE82_9DINO|nr:unnamed protein product [Symbiodinium natans]